MDYNIYRISRQSYDFTMVSSYGQVQKPAAEMDLKAESLPTFRQMGIKVEYAIIDVHASKSADNRHPGTGHTGDVQAILGVIVVIIKVQPGGPEIHLIGFIGAAQT